MKIEIDIRAELDAETDLENALPELKDDLQAGIANVIKDLMRWSEIQVSIEFKVPCWFCAGRGSVNKSDIMTGVCPECNGRG